MTVMQKPASFMILDILEPSETALHSPFRHEADEVSRNSGGLLGNLLPWQFIDHPRCCFNKSIFSDGRFSQDEVRDLSSHRRTGFNDDDDDDVFRQFPMLTQFTSDKDPTKDTSSSPAMSDCQFFRTRDLQHQHLMTKKKTRKARTTFSDHQLNELERTFEKQKYLSVQDRMQLAEKLHLSDMQVKTWYQNRRTKWKRQATVGMELLSEASAVGVSCLVQSPPHFVWPKPQPMNDRGLQNNDSHADHLMNFLQFKRDPSSAQLSGMPPTELLSMFSSEFQNAHTLNLLKCLTLPPLPPISHPTTPTPNLANQNVPSSSSLLPSNPSPINKNNSNNNSNKLTSAFELFSGRYTSVN